MFVCQWTLGGKREEVEEHMTVCQVHIWKTCKWGDNVFFSFLIILVCANVFIDLNCFSSERCGPWASCLLFKFKAHLNNWEGGDVICIPVIINTPVFNCKKN